MGWGFAGLQIPSMAYPPSSTVSYFSQICFISNLNDWLIVDGVFFVIRCIKIQDSKNFIYHFVKGTQSTRLLIAKPVLLLPDV